MATTDSRTGFRLPWSTDRAASREASADPADELAAVAPAIESSDAAAPTPGPGNTSDQDAAGDGVRGQEEALVTILAPDAAQHPVTAAPPPEPAAPADDSVAPDPASTAPARPAAPGRRPTKFLADLTRAMQAAAEQARAATLEQYRGEGTTVIEQIHGRSATGATELRRNADDDAAAIKEWSKAEIARIREETERRIGARREQLEGQLERHAAIIEHEIERVRGRISSFETEMGRFFDDLLGEDDPSVFAARAANMPEPPSFEILDDDAIAALLQEPGVGVPQVEVDAPAVGEAVADVPGSGEGELAAQPDDGAPLDREAAMAAIQAAAEAVVESEQAPGSAEPAAEIETITTEASEPTTDATDATDAYREPDPEIDPRLAMLGLTPDFAAAETAAAEAAAAEIEDLPEIGGDALEARLSGLVGSGTPAPAAPTITTQVVVTGLVSVASIASFKRHVGRLVGVAHVGVSSGPDGEFLFAVQHDPETSLRDLVPTLPGFGARVVGVGDGIVHVSAQDPQD